MLLFVVASTFIPMREWVLTQPLQPCGCGIVGTLSIHACSLFMIWNQALESQPKAREMTEVLWQEGIISFFLKLSALAQIG